MDAVDLPEIPIVETFSEAGQRIGGSAGAESGGEEELDTTTNTGNGGSHSFIYCMHSCIAGASFNVSLAVQNSCLEDAVHVRSEILDD